MGDRVLTAEQAGTTGAARRERQKKGDVILLEPGRHSLFLAGRAVRTAALLVMVSLITFSLVSLSPIDPLQANAGQALASMSQEQLEKLEAYWGVGVPPVERYLNWVKDVLKGDLGTSLLYRQPVTEVIAAKLQNSLFLLAISWAISGCLGLVLGIVAAVFRERWPDRVIRGYAILTASTPAFWLALLLLLVFSVWLKLFPIGLSVPIGMEASQVTAADRLRHAFLPALTLSITGISGIALHTREKMIDCLESDYVLFARARGEENGEIIRRHGLRNILIPAITLQFASVSEIIGGSVVVEQVFSYPGLGQAAVTAGTGSDVPLLMGITMITALVVCAGNFLADLLCGLVDPRIGKGGGTVAE